MEDKYFYSLMIVCVLCVVYRKELYAFLTAPSTKSAVKSAVN